LIERRRGVLGLQSRIGRRSIKHWQNCRLLFWSRDAMDQRTLPRMRGRCQRRADARGAHQVSLKR
jgi:hypothetical protein